MAIPYPYNRLGITVGGGSTTPLEPIEGSQGVFWYANSNKLISSAMQLVNKTIVGGNTVRVYSSGYLINPTLNSDCYVNVYSGGTAIRITRYPGIFGTVNVNGGYVKSVNAPIVYYSNGYSCASRFALYCRSNGYLENATIVGLDNTIVVSSGTLNSIYMVGGGNGISPGNSATIYNLTLGTMANNRSNLYRGGELDIGGSNILISNVTHVTTIHNTPNLGPYSNYYTNLAFTVYINGARFTNVSILDFNLSYLADYQINGFGTTIKITGSNERGSVWLSNNTLHNIVLRKGWIDINDNDTVFIESLLIPSSSAGLSIYGSGYYCGKNITKQIGGCLNYPQKWDSFSINGSAGEGGSFAYSNGVGSNIVFGGYSIRAQSVTLYGKILNPYITTSNTLYLNTGTLISPRIWGGVCLQTAASIIDYVGYPSDGGRIVFAGEMTNTPKNETEYEHVFPGDAPMVNNINLDAGASVLIIDSLFGSAINITQGSNGTISVGGLYYSRSSIYYGTTYFYKDYRVINGTNPLGSFWYSQGTFYNPYINTDLVVQNKCSLLEGNIVTEGGSVSLLNGGYISGLTVNAGELIISDAKNQMAPTAINIHQNSGGNINPGGVKKYYGDNPSSSSINGIQPTVYGTNDFGIFSQNSGIIYNWAFYNYGRAFSNLVDSVHGATSLHIFGATRYVQTIGFYCYGPDKYRGVDPSGITNIDLDYVYLHQGGVISLHQSACDYNINAGTFYVVDRGVIVLDGEGSNTSSQYLYTGVTVNRIDYLANSNSYMNYLALYGFKDHVNTINISSGANLNMSVGSNNYGVINVESGGLLAQYTYSNYGSLGGTASIHVASGGFLYLANLTTPYIFNYSGETERGSFIVSGSYISNLLYNMPRNRSALFSDRSVRASIGGIYSANGICVTNDNSLIINANAGYISAYGGTITLLDTNGTNLYSYLYVSEGYINIYSRVNASYVFLNSASASIYRHNTLSNVTINDKATLEMSSGNSIISGEVNSGGVICLGRSYYSSNNYGYSINVRSGGTVFIGERCSADALRINLGGTLIVYSYGTALNVVSNGGASIVSMQSAYITYAS